MTSHTDSPFVPATTERTSLRTPRAPSHDSAVDYRHDRVTDLYHASLLSGSGAGVDPNPEFNINVVDTPNVADNHGYSNGRSEHAGRVTSPDPYYKARLRQGFINMRNSYNEKHKNRNPTVARALNRVPNIATAMVVGGSAYNEEDYRTPVSSHQREFRGSHDAVTEPHYRLDCVKPVYKSNSSLDIEQGDETLEQAPRNFVTNLRREYGSTSSLDYINTNNDSFFQMLQEYRPGPSDQRAPAPAQIKEYLKGSVDQVGDDSEEASSPEQVPNGIVPIEQEPSSEGPQSPKLKTKSHRHRDRKSRAKSTIGESSQGILRRLIGSKSDPNEPSSRPAESSGDQEKPDDKQKRKAFVHYDCQSIGISIQDMLKRRKSLQTRRNTSTGASAASVTRTDVAETGVESNDPGDGKSNDLVLSCPYFRNELGGEEETVISLTRTTAQRRVQQLLGNRQLGEHGVIRRSPNCNGVSILDSSSSPTGSSHPAIVSNNGLILEYIDFGAYFYREFFHEMDHQNYFGMDDNLGPVAVSIRRERVVERETATGKPEGGGGLYQYRIIIRTSELVTLRGCILEDAIPSSARLSNTRGLPHKDILDFLMPELQTSSLKQGITGIKTYDQLQKLDEQRISKTYKIGIMYCAAGQSTEEEMYNNEHAGRGFEEFLDILGQRVNLKGFNKYLGGLDSKTDSAGTHSLYTNFHGNEIMFHVSTMLPFTGTNKQQLMRKRHIGNDIVTIVFQEPGALPFTPKTVRSHFQHVFIIVRVHSPNTEHVKYSVSVSRSKDVPPFGPPFPDGAMFPKSPEFVEFLLTKAINAENAAHKSEKFTAMATRTRQEYLKDLATNYVSTTPLDSASKLSKFSLGSGRKKERARIRTIPDMFARGAVVWNVKVQDFSKEEEVDCLIGIAAEVLVLVEEVSRDVIFTVPCRNILGWSSQQNSLRIFYDRGECVVVNTSNSDVDEIQEMISRLSVVTHGCEAKELTLRRSGQSHLGFHVHIEGIVAEVEHYSAAWQVGLRTGSRLVEICQEAAATLTHDQMVDLLRGSPTIKIVVIPPHEDGSPRRGIDEVRPAYLSKLTHATQSTARSYEPHQNSRDVNLGTSPGNYMDVRAVSARVESTYDNVGTHRKQASQDSMTSRSSGHGSVEGQNEGQSQLRGDGFTSGSKYYGSSKSWMSGQGSTNAEMTQEMRMQTYALYGKDMGQLKQSPSNTLDGLRKPSNSASNLSQQSDWTSSSRSSTGSRSDQRRYGSNERKRRSPVLGEDVSQAIPPNEETSRHSADVSRISTQHYSTLQLPPLRRGYSSPTGSKTTSPVNSSRNLAHMSEDSPMGKPKLQRSAHTKIAPSHSVQDDLRKLLNPDISFGDDLEKEDSPDSLYGRGNPLLHRTLSDDSLIGGGPQKSSRPLAVDLYGDVIFSSAIPSHRGHINRDHDLDNKLSPRAVPDRAMLSPRVKQGLTASNPALPLPESGVGLDWSNLVKTASKAIPDEPVKRDKDKEFSERVRKRPAPLKIKPEQRSSYLESLPPGSTTAELEARVEFLEEELKRERQRRLEAESEVHRLEEDNVRLQEESQTAAAQLRRFTEWFFNTIDKQ